MVKQNIQKFIKKGMLQRLTGMWLVVIELSQQLYHSCLENIIGTKKELGGCIMINK